MPNIKFRMVNDEALPAPHQWALIDDCGQLTAVVKSSAFGPQVVTEAIAACRMLCDQESGAVALPLQRGAVLRAG